MSAAKQKQASRDLDAEIAVLMGYPVSYWSIHAINSAQEVEGKEWRHGLFSMRAFSENRFPTEVYLADDKGDMPAQLMLVEGLGWVNIPRYSTDISAAWEVVEKMRQLKHGVVIADTCGQAPWVVDFDNGQLDATVENESLPLAICLAALKCVGESNV